ncbi:hypothetical protein F5Y04DRAFT_289982 [Hypomontagnella monticulosa]|nr:hypothetical protein F5Y04DRAFT_289982 [Hypomontagnella monticulosa]
MSVALTPEQIKYLEDRIDETRVPTIHICNGIFVGAATISVVLRFLSRRLGHLGLGKDDYCLFIAYVLYLCFAVALGVTTLFGEGRHVILVTDFRALAINTLVSTSFYIFGMACVKYSILFLYYRIFPDKQFHNILFGVAAIVSSWAIASFLASIFNCYPVEKTWDSSIPGKCINYGTVTLVLGIINILLDFLILGMPMPKLWKLHISVRRKFFLSIAFATGCIACVVSIARLFYAEKTSVASTMSDIQDSPYDPSWDDVWPALLGNLEICTGIVACCAITYRPLIERIFGSSPSDVQEIYDERRAWNKIGVNQEAINIGGSPASLTRRDERQGHLQEWELRESGLGGNWK